ncbi:MAG: hypothetical protein IJO96_08855 [Oscillospiraceae bacterium]|nr:hypothetical protein [Oscillospiraceae bacterium]
MAGNRIKKKRKVRWFPLLICLIVMFNAIVIYRILTNLWDYLEEYEAAQPTGTIERYMEELKNGDYSKLMKYTEYVTDEFNSEEDFGEYMAKFLGDTSELTYTKTSTKPDGTINYAIYFEKDNVKIQEITLTPTEDKAAPFDISFGIEYLEPYYIEAPTHATVYVNGVALDDSYKTGEEVVNESFSVILTEGVVLPSRCFYSIDGLLCPPEITAKDHNGVECAVEVNEKERSYSFSLPVKSGDSFDEYADLITEATCTYAQFITEDATFDMVTRNIYTDTSFYKAISTFYNGWYINHDSYEFSNIVVRNMENVGENAFTGEISFMYTIKRKNKVYEYPSNYKASFMYFEELGWKMVNLEVI